MLGASRDLFTYYFICRPKSQILTLTAEATKQCTRFKEGDQSDLDLLHSMEQIFKSQACLNGSFLLSQDKHFSCSSRNYGVDLKAAQMAFDNLRKVENQSIKQVVSADKSMIMLRIPSHEHFNILDLGQFNKRTARLASCFSRRYGEYAALSITATIS